MKAVKIIKCKWTKSDFDECYIGGCPHAAHYHIILLGDEIILCSSHMKQFYAEVLELCDNYQELCRTKDVTDDQRPLSRE